MKSWLDEPTALLHYAAHLFIFSLGALFLFFYFYFWKLPTSPFRDTRLRPVFFFCQTHQTAQSLLRSWAEVNEMPMGTLRKFEVQPGAPGNVIEEDFRFVWGV